MRIGKSFESVSLCKAALTALAVLFSIMVAYANTPAQQLGASGSPVSPVYGAFWQVGDGYSSELVLKNDDPRNVAAVQVTLFGNTGQQSGSAQVQIAANSVNRVDLASIVGPQGGSGGLMYAPWWLLDEGTEGRITLFNSSAQAVVVSASRGDAVCSVYYDSENTVET
jgi:hypothetical protein